MGETGESCETEVQGLGKCVSSAGEARYGSRWRREKSEYRGTGFRQVGKLGKLGKLGKWATTGKVEIQGYRGWA